MPDRKLVTTIASRANLVRILDNLKEGIIAHDMQRHIFFFNARSRARHRLQPARGARPRLPRSVWCAFLRQNAARFAMADRFFTTPCGVHPEHYQQEG